MGPRAQASAYLLLILLAAAALRFHSLASNPPAVFCDEIAIALNARSIALTGEDSSGRFLPLYPHEPSFDTWKLTDIVYQPVFVYTAIPFALAFGNSPLAVRVPAVLWGLLGILGTYLLGRQLFGRRAGLLAAALLAISPWHLHFSRVGFEAISLTAFLTIGSYALLRGLNQPRFLLAGALLLSAGTYCYPPAKLFAPLLFAGFLISYRPQLWPQRRRTALAIALAVTLGLPNLYAVLHGDHQGRAAEITILKANLERERGFRLLAKHRAESPTAARIADDRRLLIPFVFVHNYLSYYSPDFLFDEGDPNLRHSMSGQGVLLLALVPLLLLGAIAMWRDRKQPSSPFLLFWLLTFPVAASLTTGQPHALRAITALPVFELIAALGADRLLRAAGDAKRRGSVPRLAYPLAFGIAALALIETVSFWRAYTTHYPMESARWWQHGVREAVIAARDRRRAGEMIHVTPSIFNSYLFIVFHADIDLLALDPELPLYDRLDAHGFHIAIRGHEREMKEGDLVLMRAAWAGKIPHWERVADFPYPDGKPNLILLRVGRT